MRIPAQDTKKTPWKLEHFFHIFNIFPCVKYSGDYQFSIASLSVYLIRQTELISLSLSLSLSLLLSVPKPVFLLAFGWNKLAVRRREKKEKGNSPELVVECNPSLPSRKHQHVIILTAAALQLTVMYTREILLVAVRETFCQQYAAENRDTNKITVN